jgi:catechol 2,3-dioxygenase-like lactoylglutathione lyase family enzyme
MRQADVVTVNHSTPFRNIDHIALAIPRGKEDEARAFYVDLLGLAEQPKPAELIDRGGVWLRSGDVFVHLGVDDDFRAATKAHPAFRCADYEALLQRVRSHGAHLVEDAFLFDGKPHCYVADPFGNRIELIKQ